ncbi:MAG: hypothetical protein A3J09_00800 [Candidatus Zambryskibacteria bacterium RIFCSPLOWO2_02_FULL_51_21]|uniref:Uncharacterized protein n=1 Tax=Candidatus Zambryskibacteria bacterium RIFCSPHIGHO2_02_FULL_43_37 TaxID=1802749 RepID=A0A1G2TI50_9BACT|nr:MAG: hypothetical protein A2723_00800 [Candidatus Zambryskibacteria bacterium RIFCSPHIGHO2_01_FULL_52_18]OHA96738.1 MAG: hypothetical protein A3D49_02760 [Candidatus Zambryskibacteria bacterium RIFCSPHIGHO2_02_FULL_43_37]OHB07431.1 MAG: hypothetical protein A2944_01830 [Candidatus Zambryskibacteria bacterium RIFCSPLOWO2_01_FULL_52_12]OHB11094.1 MAG: hypothetical protein A3J09_00800 [Candidatus Zambryskibacteria bacterium RIFCSPLOWO2_02_FULL_51_21]
MAKKISTKIMPDERPLTNAEFLESYNKNMPEGYPRVTLSQLERFKEVHASLFKNKGVWTLDHHRKRMIDWLPQNI